MTRDDLVKQLEKAEQWQAATRDHHISISFPASEAIFRAGVALHIWDTAYAAGAKDKTLKPLTYEQIAELNLSAVTTTDAVNDVRVIELAHGIGVKND